jgi:hypothetical protein
MRYPAAFRQKIRLPVVVLGIGALACLIFLYYQIRSLSAVSYTGILENLGEYKALDLQAEFDLQTQNWPRAQQDLEYMKGLVESTRTAAEAALPDAAQKFSWQLLERSVEGRQRILSLPPDSAGPTRWAYLRQYGFTERDKLFQAFKDAQKERLDSLHLYQLLFYLLSLIFLSVAIVLAARRG